MLPHEREADELPVRLLRAMSPERKLEVAASLRSLAWEVAAAGCRLREPGLDEATVQARVREGFLHADS